MSGFLQDPTTGVYRTIREVGTTTLLADLYDRVVISGANNVVGEERSGKL